MGGIKTVPNPIQSIKTEMIDVVEEIVDLFTYWDNIKGSVNLTVRKAVSVLFTTENV